MAEGLAAEPVSLVFKARANASKLKRRNYEGGIWCLGSATPNPHHLIPQTWWRYSASHASVPEAPTAVHASEACLDVTFPRRSLRINDSIGLGPAVRNLDYQPLQSWLPQSYVRIFLKLISSQSLQHSRSLGDLPVWDFEMIFMLEIFVELRSAILLSLELS